MNEAEQACMNIFNDYSWEEMKGFSPAISKAWLIGEYLIEKENEQA